MSDHLSTHDLEQLLRDGTPLDRLAAAAAHLARCPGCSERMRSLPATQLRSANLEHAFAPVIATGHLEYAELEGFIDATLPDDQIGRVEGHIAVCSGCRMQVDEMRQLAPVEVPSPIAAAATGSSFLDEVWALFVPKLPVWGLAAVCLVAGFSLWFIYYNEPPERAVEIQTGPNTTDVQISESPPDAPAAATDLVENTPGLDPDPAISPRTPTDELRATLEDGGQTVGVDAAGNVVGYAGLSGKYQDRVQQALDNGRVRLAPLPEDLSMEPDPTMGDHDGENLFKINGPAGKMLLTDRPALSWQPLKGSDSYRVDVFDSNFKKVASSGELSATSWSTRLARGRTYSWQVTATKDGSEYKTPRTPQPAARFHIISSERYSEINSIKKQYPGSHLLLAIAYADAGLRDEAVSELKIVERQNPQSPLPKRLLKQLRDPK